MNPKHPKTPPACGEALATGPASAARSPAPAVSGGVRGDSAVILPKRTADGQREGGGRGSGGPRGGEAGGRGEGGAGYDGH